jgi:hypothetical protein
VECTWFWSGGYISSFIFDVIGNQNFSTNEAVRNMSGKNRNTAANDNTEEQHRNERTTQ